MNGKNFLFKNIGTALLSLLGTLLVLEVVLRMAWPQPTKFFYFKYDYSPGEIFYRWDGIEVRINSHGERDHERTAEKPSGVYRVAILGDSVAFGSGVRVEDTYAKRLEALLNKGAAERAGFEVLTFTNGGTEPTGYLDKLRNRALKFRPDLIIVGLTLNDFERPHVVKSPRESYYDALRFIHMRMRVWSHLYFLTLERSRSVLYKFRILDKSVRRGYEMDVLETKGEQFNEAWRFTQKTLSEIQDLAAKNNARFAMVVFPYEMQLTVRLLNRYRDAFGFSLSDDVLEGKPQRVLQEYAHARGFALIDVFDAFKRAAAAGEQLYFREFGGALDFVHPNRQGHAIAGRVLYDAFRCGRILPSHIVRILPKDECPAGSMD